MTTDDEWLPVEVVANRLKLSVRQATRYQTRVRTKRAGRRILFHPEDVEMLATEIGVEYRPPVPPRAELMPAGEVLQTFERQQERLAALERERGRLEGMLQTQQRLLEDADETRRQLEASRAERDRLQAELDKLRRRSWWQRLLDR